MTTRREDRTRAPAESSLTARLAGAVTGLRAVAAQAAGAVASVAGHYATFSGRATRREFWWWSAFLAAVVTVVALIQLLVLGDGTRGAVAVAASFGTEILAALLVLALFVPSQAVLVRRLHDANLSGWYALLGLIPLLGALMLLAVALLPSAATETPVPDAASTA
ncbi:DUF805 domain-containing protein [Cryobacterium frigoriphilum]|uniref:DUF805 domain-containing protein n=1 Tax=Cryobacterium frigoriphilum TaxID=1259150 RepID=UPI00141B61FC|nr:DUF805 domain-containing protein [Cryobacterium frigoriphilum]